MQEWMRSSNGDKTPTRARAGLYIWDQYSMANLTNDKTPTQACILRLVVTRMRAHIFFQTGTFAKKSR
jgi:hypothetical protein